MWRWRARLIKGLLPATIALLLLYTADQLLTGERGIVTWRLMHQQIDQLHQDITALQADVDHLKSQTSRLRPDEQKRLDEDYVDEEIRRQLPLGKPGEQIILISPETVVPLTN